MSIFYIYYLSFFSVQSVKKTDVITVVVIFESKLYLYSKHFPH